MSKYNSPTIKVNTIISFNTFITELLKVGFTLAGYKDGIFTLCDYFGDNIESHTDDPDTDPWVWRMKSILERNDIVYGKIFFNKGGYITKEWFPYFYALRRRQRTFEETYASGEISYMAKEIYDIIAKQPNISLHEIKLAVGATKESKPQIDQAITQLQMKLFITISGQTYKTSKDGQPYGWPVTTFKTIDKFIDDDILTASQKINPEESFHIIQRRILQLNPDASTKKIQKFIYG